MLTRFRALLVLSCVVCTVGRGQVLFINVANSAAVTFTGTGAFAANNYSVTGTQAFPVRLTGFFTADQSNFDFLDNSSTLATTGAGHSLGRAFLRVGAGGPRTLLLRQNGNSQELFSTSSAAFSGVAMFDLSSVAPYLPSVGATGNILAADGTTIVGTYSVVSAVPEPATYAAFAGIGALALALRRRRRAT